MLFIDSVSCIMLIASSFILIVQYLYLHVNLIPMYLSPILRYAIVSLQVRDFALFAAAVVFSILIIANTFVIFLLMEMEADM